MARLQENPNGSTPSGTSFPAPSGFRILAADPDVVLRVARGIVGIAAGIVGAEVRLSRGMALQPESASATKARRIGIRIRVLQFNGDEAGAQESLVYLAIKSIVQDEAASQLGGEGGLRPLTGLAVSEVYLARGRRRELSRLNFRALRESWRCPSLAGNRRLFHLET